MGCLSYVVAPAGRFDVGTPPPQEILTGRTASEVLSQMRGESMFTWSMTLEEYIAHVIDRTREWASVEIDVHGQTLEQRAQSLLDQLVAAKLLQNLDGTAGAPLA